MASWVPVPESAIVGPGRIGGPSGIPVTESAPAADGAGGDAVAAALDHLRRAAHQEEVAVLVEVAEVGWTAFITS